MVIMRGQLTQRMEQVSLTFAMKTTYSLKSVHRIVPVMLMEAGQMKTSSAVSLLE